MVSYCWQFVNVANSARNFCSRLCWWRCSPCSRKHSINHRILNGAEKWCQQMQLSINPEKKRRWTCLQGDTNQKISRTLILTRQVKYIGVLDHKLSFRHHVEHKCCKAIMAFHQVRRCTDKIWGYSPGLFIGYTQWLFGLCSHMWLSYVNPEAAAVSRHKPP